MKFENCYEAQTTKQSMYAKIILTEFICNYNLGNWYLQTQFNGLPNLFYSMQQKNERFTYNLVIYNTFSI